MLVLFLMTLFVTLLLVSLDRPPVRGLRVLRQLGRGALGIAGVAAGTALAVQVLPSEWQLPAAEATVWAAPGESSGGEPPANASEPSASEPGASEPSASEPGAEEPGAAEPSESKEVSTPDDTLPFDLEEGTRRVRIPYESRPEWVSFQKDLTGDVHRIPITAGPFVQKSECMKALDSQVQEAVARYVNNYLGSPRASMFIHVEQEGIHRRLLSDEHVHDEVIQVGDLGAMHQVHALLEFDPQFRAELDQSWREVQASKRLAQTGLGAFGILGLLAVVFGYFKLDTATRGYYSTRLQILASLAILSLVAAGILIYGWIPRL